MRTPIRLAALISLFVLFDSAQAQTLPKWELGAGFTYLYIPHYRGSLSKESLFIPFPYLIYRSDTLKVDEDGVRSRIFGNEDLRLDFSLAGGPPSSSDENGARKGMDELAPTFEIGPSLEWRLWRKEKQRSLWLKFPLRAAFSVGRVGNDSGIIHQGWAFAPYLEYKIETYGNRRWKGSLSVGPLFADDNYHGYFYSVTPAEATAERPSYIAPAGYSGSRVTWVYQRQVTKSLWLAAYARADTLKNASFSDSPLVETERYAVAGFAFTWILTRSSQAYEIP